MVEWLIFAWPKRSNGIILYHLGTSSQRADRRGWPINIFKWFVGSGGWDKILTNESYHTCDILGHCANRHCPIYGIRVSWLIHVCDMTHSYMWHDTFVYVAWLIHVCDMTHLYVWHTSFTRVTWRIHMCDMTHSYVWHDSFICVTRLSHTNDETRPLCDMTHSHVWHDSSGGATVKKTVGIHNTPTC